MHAQKERLKENHNRAAGHSVAHNRAGMKQLFGFIDNRPRSKSQITLQRVAQLERFDAGSGSVWHIHHDHIKLGNNQDSRVNFNGRSKKEIRKELGEKIERYGLNVGGDLAASFRECIDYINSHF